jgi:hypothetical protein
MGLWESSGSPAPSKRKIAYAFSEETWDRGKREFNVKVRLVGSEKIDRQAYWEYTEWPGQGVSEKEYRFDYLRDADDCANWLIGRDYIGPK